MAMHPSVSNDWQTVQVRHAGQGSTLQLLIYCIPEPGLSYGSSGIAAGIDPVLWPARRSAITRGQCFCKLYIAASKDVCKMKTVWHWVVRSSFTMISCEAVCWSAITVAVGLPLIPTGKTHVLVQLHALPTETACTFLILEMLICTSTYSTLLSLLVLVRNVPRRSHDGAEQRVLPCLQGSGIALFG